MATKWRRIQDDTVSEIRSEIDRTTEGRPGLWTRLWQRPRARARIDIRLPGVRVPEVTLPSVSFPEVRVPDLKLQARLPDVRLPDVKVPDLSLPDVRIPDLQMPDVRLDDVREAAMDAARWPRRAWQRRERARRAATWTARGVTTGLVAGAAILGAAAAYFLDPDRGRGRRIQTADRLGAIARRTGRHAERLARHTAASASAMGHRWMRPRGEYIAPNDATLSAKVESELFRDPTIEKGRININVENGVVVLRGSAASEDQIRRIVAAVTAIPGVRTVRDLLGVPARATSDVMTPIPEEQPAEMTGTDATVESTPGY